MEPKTWLGRLLFDLGLVLGGIRQTFRSRYVKFLEQEVAMLRAERAAYLTRLGVPAVAATTVRPAVPTATNPPTPPITQSVEKPPPRRRRGTWQDVRRKVEAPRTRMVQQGISPSRVAEINKAQRDFAIAQKVQGEPKVKAPDKEVAS